MTNLRPDARPEGRIDPYDLDPRPRIGAQAVCDTCDWEGTPFATHNAIFQASRQAEAMHNIEGHIIKIVDVPLR